MVMGAVLCIVASLGKIMASFFYCDLLCDFKKVNSLLHRKYEIQQKYCFSY